MTRFIGKTPKILNSGKSFMKIKNYKVSESEIRDWWFGLSLNDCSKRYNPSDIIDDLRTGRKEWYYKGIPLRLKLRNDNL